MAKSLLEVKTEAEAKRNPKAEIGKLAELLDKSGIKIEDIGKINRVNLWEGFYKDEEGVAQTVNMAGIQLTPTWDTGPEWPVVQVSKPVNVKLPKNGKPLDKGRWKRAVILPDIQFGYFRDTHDILHPIQDEAALDVALQLVKEINPHVIVMVGDNMDNCELGKYRHSPAFARTMQATIDRAGLFCAQLRSICPEAEIIWLCGNHEQRLTDFILDNAKAAFGLKKANAPDSWPVLSVPELCRLDEYGVTFVPGYPASSFWINERLKVIHGNKVNSNGSTVHKYLTKERVSTISGHIHRVEMGHITRESHDGPRTIMAMSPGCLARIDGVVPSTKGGIDLDGLPIPSTEDWQQAIGVVTYEEGDGKFIPEIVPIHEGWTLYRGKEFLASVDVEGNPI